MDKKRTQFYVEGVGSIPSVEEMAQKSGKTIKKLLELRGKGADDECIFHNKRFPKYVVNGVSYYTFLDLCYDFGITLSLTNLTYKLSKGASIEEVIEEQKTGKKPDYYIKNKTGIKFTLEGVEYNSVQEAYDYYKKKGDERLTESYSAVRKRFDYGMDPYDCFFTPNLRERKE